MTYLQSLGHRLLRVPLFYKILLANCAIVAVGAVGGTRITVWHMETFPDDPHYELMAVFGVVGFAISFAVNLLVLRLALRPLDRLQHGVDSVRRGDLSVRVGPEPLSDERFDRLLAMLPGPTTVLAIDEHTACIVDLDRGSCLIHGAGCAYLVQSGDVRAFASGDSFILDEAGTVMSGRGDDELARVDHAISPGI